MKNRESYNSSISVCYSDMIYKSSISVLDYRMEMLLLSFGGVRNGMRFLQKICRGLTAAYFKERTNCQSNRIILSCLLDDNCAGNCDCCDHCESDDAAVGGRLSAALGLVSGSLCLCSIRFNLGNPCV